MRPSLPALLVGHWQLNSALLVQGGACAGVYMCGARRLGRRWPVRRTVSFLAGMAVVLVALQSGVDAYSERLLSVHMVQHMLLLLVAPALLLWGRPVLLALRVLPRPARRSLARGLGRIRPLTAPVACLTIFCAVVTLTHLPSFYDSTLRAPAVHAGEHAVYLLAGMLLWWPLVDADPAPVRRLGGLGRLGYFVVAMVPMAIIGAYLNRYPAIAYVPYAAPARAMGVSALVDQADSGAIMWVIGDMIMVAVGLWCTVAALVAEERRQRVRDARAGAALRTEVR